MAKKQEPFEPTDTLKHRYASEDVLRSVLIELGFKDKEIEISVRETLQADRLIIGADSNYLGQGVGRLVRQATQGID